MAKVGAGPLAVYRYLTSALRAAGRNRAWLRAGGQALSDLLFPPQCYLCGEETEGGKDAFCLRCRQALVDVPGRCCPRCARPTPRYSQVDAGGCLLCREKKLRFQRTMALGIYGGAVRDLILRMKQARHESLSLATGRLLAARVAQSLDCSGIDLVAPVPMHWLRRLGRGVNDAELLSEAVAQSLQRPFQPRLVRCRRRTLKQGTLLPPQRRANVRGAYRVAGRIDLTEAHVLLVDDVMTTGATANEIAGVLRRRGAREVSIAVVARGVGFD